MSKEIFIFYLSFVVILINTALIRAYHGSLGGGASASPLTVILIIVGTLVIFILIIWFFRKASAGIEKKK